MLYSTTIPHKAICTTRKCMKIKVVLRQGSASKSGEAPLMLRFTDHRKARFVALGISIHPKFWDEERESITANHPNKNELQSKIESKKSEFAKRIAKLEALEIPVTFESVIDNRNQSVRVTIREAFESEIKRLTTLGKFKSRDKYKFTLSALAKFRRTDIPFDSIDTTFLKSFEEWMYSVGNSTNTIATRFSVLKALFNKMLKEKRITVKENPFNSYKVANNWKSTRKRAISKEEVGRIIALKIEVNHYTEYKRFARDIFLFSYYSAGMNFGDIARLQYGDISDGRIRYSRQKTKRRLSCRLSPQLEEIMRPYLRHNAEADDYIFPILDKNIHTTDQQIYHRLAKTLGKVNRELKKLGTELGLSHPLTTYVARHTYATVMKRAGVNLALISETLGHSSLTTTQIYLDSFDNEQIDEAMKLLA